MNPPIPIKKCFVCGKPTNETQSKWGVAHRKCYDGKIKGRGNGFDGV